MTLIKSYSTKSSPSQKHIAKTNWTFVCRH